MTGSGVRIPLAAPVNVLILLIFIGALLFLKNVIAKKEPLRNHGMWKAVHELRGSVGARELNGISDVLSERGPAVGVPTAIERAV
jgi:hypothetical protein